MKEEDKAVVRSTIHRLLTADNNEVFAIDTWATKFKGWGCENLPTGYVRPFSQTPFDGYPTWPERDAPGHRVAAAATLRGAFLIDDFRADHKQVGQDKTGMLLPTDLAMQITEGVLKSRRMGSDRAWRRGFVTAGALAWRDASGAPPGSSNLDANGLDQHGYSARFTFNRFLLDSWRETGLAPVRFSRITALGTSD